MLDPVKIAARFEPPSLALLYSKQGGQFVHEFPIEQNDLCDDTEDIYDNIANNHPGYLSGVDPDQVMDLIDKIKEYYVMDDNQLDFLTKEIADMDLQSGDSGILDYADVDFNDLEAEMGDYSFNGTGEINMF